MHKALFFLIVLSCVSIFPPAHFAQAQNSAATIGSITFEGNRSIPSAQLARMLRRSRDGRQYIPEDLKADLLQVKNAYQEAGFLEVKLDITDVQIRKEGDRELAAIRIGVNEGRLYSTGEIAVKNEGVLAPGTLVQLCPLEKGRPYSRKKAADWQAKIEDAYRGLGYIKSRCQVRETLKHAGTVDCTLECTEGKLYTVGKITVTGNGSVNPLEFKRRLLVSEGAAFNPEMLVMSIQFLNQIRLYEPISSSDVQINIDDEKAAVELIFRVAARAPQQPGS